MKYIIIMESTVFYHPIRSFVLAVFSYGITILVKKYYRWRTTPLRRIPGPPVSSFMWGYMMLILREPYFEIHKKWWMELRDKNNGKSPPFMVYSLLFGQYTLLILSPDIVKVILTEQASRDPVRFQKKYGMLKECIGKGLVTLEGSAWSRHRRIIQPCFNLKLVKEGVNRAVGQHVTTVIESWIATQGCDIDVFAHVSALTLDIIGDVAFSHDFGACRAIETWAQCFDASDVKTQEPGIAIDVLISAFQKSLKLNALGYALILMELSWLEKYLNRAVANTRSKLNAAVDEVIANARTTTPTHKSLLHSMLEASDSESDRCEQASLSDLELRDEIKTFILAGHETTSTWVYWALYALSKFPDVQEKVYKEVRRSKPDCSIPITSDDADEMPYFCAFLSEILRFYSPVGAVIRFTSQEETWDGYTIPRNTRMVVPMHLLHRHPDYWINPETFFPERWLDKEACEERHRFCYVPFLAGPRNCIGQRFAEMEVKAIVSNLVRTFSIQLAPCMRDKDITFTSFLTMKSTPPIVIRVRKR